ncbi:MAG: DUF5017 domain-containing protein [Mucilaginibacter sp.]|uniref:DUF5017 domain-containing protein n=1 Tax=Mucilaginibacter sp. TaxID=1882438 RepID=UPI00326783A9
MKNIYVLLLVSLIIGGCKKLEVASPLFDVQTVKLTYKINDTVRFNISGNAGNILFYSGEQGFTYANRTRLTADGTPQFSFNSTRGGGAQDNSLMVMVSTDLSVVDSSHVVHATWTDITGRSVLSTGTALGSGNIDLSDFKNNGQPVWLAFKYLGTKSATLAQRTWIIKSLLVNNILPDGTVAPIATIADASWSSINIKNPAAIWVIPNTATITQITINGGVANSDDNEDWLITRPLTLNKIAPDLSRSIQNIGSDALTNYSYVYTKPGTYHVTFVGFNNSVDDQKSIIKEFDIVVTP